MPRAGSRDARAPRRKVGEFSVDITTEEPPDLSARGPPPVLENPKSPAARR
jgi:hypothetical protein